MKNNKNCDDSYVCAPFALANPAIMRYNNTEHRTQNTEHRTQNTEHRTQNTEHRTQNTEHVIEVVLAIHDPKGTYARYGGVVVTSIFSNTRSSVHVTLLHDSTLTEENRRRFERTAERWRQRISFIDVSGHVARIAKNPDKAASFYTQGALFRILIPELLTVPKVIYLDCDVVVNLDIAEFWAVSGQEEARSAFLIAARSPGGGAKYNWLIRCHSKIRGWGLPPVLQDESRLFNSGVLLMNLSRIREEHDLTKEAFDFFERYGRFAAQPDNDFLCAVFSRAGDVFWTEERFNRGGDFYNVGNAIVHAAGAQPWNVFRDTPRDDLFWKTLAESEWGGDLLEMLRKRPIETYRASDGIRLLFARASVYKDRFIALIGMLFYCLCKRRPRA